MSSCCILLMALLLPLQRWTAQVSGEVLDREGKPMAGAEIIYKNIGKVTDVRTETPRIIEGNGRVYKVKTDKKGTFILVGMEYGVYQVEVKAPGGSTVYTGKKLIGDNTDPNASNTLKVDLSLVLPGAVAPGAETNLSDSRKSKEQLALIRQENSNAAKINRLIVQFQGALDVHDWPGATSLLEQLIAIDPNRWEFYQNLGTIQANLTHYQDAAQSFAKGVEVADKLLASAADPAQTKDNIADMLMSEGDAYNRMDKLDESIELYRKAAALSSKPAQAHFHACNTLANHGKTAQATEECNQAIAADPSQWEFYQLLAGQQYTQGKYDEALETYEKGIAAAKKILAESPDAQRAKTGLGQMLNSEGNLLVHVKKYGPAIDAFGQAAEFSAYPAMSYFNLCATLYNVRREQEALSACDRALASDSTMSDAYFIKASILFGQGRLEGGRYVVPPGTTELLNKYLVYAPFGEHANTVRGMIDKINAGIETQYKPAKK
jgi:tetratricopeptide (TPR) repeat protein